MTTESMGDVFCSVCGVIGQLQRYRPNTFAIDFITKGKNGKIGGNVRPAYYRVTHFKNKKGKIVNRIPIHRMNKRYAYECYLGSVVVVSGYEIVYPQPTAFAVGKRMEHFLVI